MSPRRVVAAGAVRFAASPSASFCRQPGSARRCARRRLAQLLQDRLAVADDRDVDVRPSAQLLGSISMRAIFASALKRGGAACPMT